MFIDLKGSQFYFYSLYSIRDTLPALLVSVVEIVQFVWSRKLESEKKKLAFLKHSYNCEIRFINSNKT